MRASGARKASREGLSLPSEDSPKPPILDEAALSQAVPIFEATPNAIIAVDAAGRILYANPRALAVFEYTRDELIGASVASLVPERFPIGQAERPQLPPAPPGHATGTQLDLAGRRHDGSEFPVEISLSPVETTAGTIVYAMIVDVSARRAAAEALAASEHRFRTVLQASPNAIIAVDKEGDIVYANPQVEATFGYEPGELIGTALSMILPERIRERHLVHHAQFFERPAARPMGLGRDFAGRRRDGTEFPVEISLSPVQTDEGLLSFATVIDITARKAAETALAESEHRFRTVLEASPNAIIAIDREGLIVYANPNVEETFGYGRDELIGQVVERLLPEGIGDRHIDHRHDFFEHPASRPMGVGLDLSGRRRDGTEFPVEISLSPVETGDGLLVFATVADITVRKGLENQLLQAQKMESIGRLAGGIAHDFNNMLSAIRGYADFIEDDLAADRADIDLDDVRRSAAAITNATERAAALTASLLAFARQQILEPQTLDVRELARGVEPMLRRLIGERIRLVMSLDPATGSIRADPGQLDQIIINLVINARDALPAGGKITVQTANHSITEPYAIEHFDVSPGDYVMLAVSDDGTGMDVETRKHIFEPFFTTKEVGKGTGLGLASIFGIVRQSGGHIWLYSEPGRGTTFKLYFPRVEGAGPESTALAPAMSERGSGRILVVEDEASVRELIVRVLGRAGYAVEVAKDGMSALTILGAEGEPIAAIVSDVVMPGMSGTEIAAAVLDRFPDTGILLLSGYTAETLHLRDVLARGARFLGKPFSADQLARAVAGAIRAEVGRPTG